MLKRKASEIPGDEHTKWLFNHYENRLDCNTSEEVLLALKSVDKLRALLALEAAVTPLNPAKSALREELLFRIRCLMDRISFGYCVDEDHMAFVTHTAFAACCSQRADTDKGANAHQGKLTVQTVQRAGRIQSDTHVRVVHLFRKCLPHLAQMRNLCSIAARYAEASPYTSSFLLDSLVCTLIGGYRHTRSVPTFEQRRVVYRILKPFRDSAVNFAAALSVWNNDLLLYFALRERLVFCVAGDKALHDQLARTQGWLLFEQHVILAGDMLRQQISGTDTESIVWTGEIHDLRHFLPQGIMETLRRNNRRCSSLARAQTNTSASLNSGKQQSREVLNACRRVISERGLRVFLQETEDADVMMRRFSDRGLLLPHTHPLGHQIQTPPTKDELRSMEDVQLACTHDHYLKRVNLDDKHLVTLPQSFVELQLEALKQRFDTHLERHACVLVCSSCASVKNFVVSTPATTAISTSKRWRGSSGVGAPGSASAHGFRHVLIDPFRPDWLACASKREACRNTQLVKIPLLEADPFVKPKGWILFLSGVGFIISPCCGRVTDINCLRACGDATWKCTACMRTAVQTHQPITKLFDGDLGKNACAFCRVDVFTKSGISRKGVRTNIHLAEGDFHFCASHARSWMESHDKHPKGRDEGNMTLSEAFENVSKSTFARFNGKRV